MLGLYSTLNGILGFCFCIKNDNINKYDCSNSIIEPCYYSLRKIIERI